MKYEDTLEYSIIELKKVANQTSTPLLEALQGLNEAINKSLCSSVEWYKAYQAMQGNHIKENDHISEEPVKEIIEQTRPETSAETDNPNENSDLEIFEDIMGDKTVLVNPNDPDQIWIIPTNLDKPIKLVMETEECDLNDWYDKFLDRLNSSYD